MEQALIINYPNLYALLAAGAYTVAQSAGIPQPEVMHLAMQVVANTPCQELGALENRAAELTYDQRKALASGTSVGRLNDFMWHCLVNV